MGHQTKVSELNGSPAAASKGLARNVGEFAHDVLTLAELQGRLLIADVQEFRQRMVIPGLVLLGGVMLGLACFPIALAGLAFALVEVLELSNATGFLLALVIGAVLSAVLCVIGWLQVRSHVAVLGRSKREFAHNLSWIKKVLERICPDVTPSTAGRRRGFATRQGDEPDIFPAPPARQRTRG
jgi:Putative Actinobacterial Holin-X, holin superfamily III